MHWDNNSKQGCITLKVYRTPNKIKVTSEDLATPIIVSGKSLHKIIVHANLIDCSLSSIISKASSSLFMVVNKENEDLNINCNTNSKLKINCGVICTRSELDKVLKVSPNFIFLSKSNNFTDDVYIISNVVWNIN
jgi:hypothetical protein